MTKYDRRWKKENRQASCTLPPWAIYIPPMDRGEVLRKIRQECIDVYGYSFDECPKRKVCLKKECMGRPLPWESETAKPLLEKLRQSQEIVDDELIIETDCTICPMFKTCNNPCNQVLDFIDRGKSMEITLNYEENLENIVPDKIKLESSMMLVSPEDIPWDILSERKQKVIKKYLYEQRDFRHVAETLDMYNQAFAKYEFYSALNKLSEYAVFRKFLKSGGNLVTPRQYEILNMIYLENKRIVQVADELGTSKQNVQQMVARVTSKHNIKWTKFVRRKGNKTIYTTLEVLK